MNILLVIDGLGSGGAQRQMALLARGLAERGHAITLFLYFPNHDFYKNLLDASNIKVVSVQKKGRFDLSPLHALKSHIKANSYDAAVAFLPTPSIYLLAARGLRKGLPVVVSHRRTFEQDRIPPSERLRLAIYAAAQKIVSNSQRGSDQIAASLPFLASKLRVISNAVEMERFASAPTINDNARTDILFVGRLAPEKNIIRVMEAMAIIRERGEPLPMISWAGRYAGGAAADRYAVDLRECMDKLGLSDCWKPLGERSDIPQLLTKCGAVLLPSTFEGTPNAVCEGLAAGRPILASRVGDIGSLVQDGTSGFLFDPMDPTDIADAISRFMRTTAAQRTEMGKAGRSFAEKTFSLEAYIDSWEDCIHSLVQQ